MCHRLVLRMVIILLFGSVSATALAQDYEIRLTRPSKVGDKHRFRATGSESQRMEVTTGNRVLHTSEEKFVYEISADATVLETDAKGRVTSESLVVVNSKLLMNGAPRIFLPPGLNLVATVEGKKTVFKMDGKPLDNETSRVLSSAISLSTGGPDDDEIFGTRSRKKVGESWPINLTAMMDMLKKMEMPAKREDIKGKATLEKVEGDHLFVSALMTVRLQDSTLPAEAKISGGEVRAEFSGRFPLGTATGDSYSATKIVATFTIRREPPGSDTEMHTKMSFESNEAYEILLSPDQHNALEKSTAKNSSDAQTEKTTASDPAGEVKTMWVIPAGFENLAPFEVWTVANQTATPPPEVAVKTGTVVIGKAVKRVEPEYPALAKKAKIAGQVVVEVVVDEEGNVIWARAGQAHPLLKQAAEEAARQWKFLPTTFNGAAVKALGAITLNFEM